MLATRLSCENIWHLLEDNWQAWVDNLNVLNRMQEENWKENSPQKDDDKRGHKFCMSGFMWKWHNKFLSKRKWGNEVVNSITCSRVFQTSEQYQGKCQRNGQTHGTRWQKCPGTEFQELERVEKNVYARGHSTAAHWNGSGYQCQPVDTMQQHSDCTGHYAPH